MVRKLILELPVPRASPQRIRQVEYKLYPVQFALQSFGIYCTFQSDKRLQGISNIELKF